MQSWVSPHRLRLQEEAHLDRDKYNEGDQYAQDQRLLPVADAEVQGLGDESAIVCGLQASLCFIIRSCSDQVQAAFESALVETGC